ncbi:hypothetical protein BS78_02G052600 [Paspalum vaginatum]|nr:hypothetical protein BS78_02G052600 [Paspalum vaginatum]
MSEAVPEGEPAVELRAGAMVPAERYAASVAAAWSSPPTLPQRSTIASRPNAAPSMAGTWLAASTVGGD